MRSCLIVTALLLALAPAPVWAQGRQGPSTDDLLNVAYSLRRKGDFREAAAIFEQTLNRLGREPARKREVALEVAELYRVTNQPVRALLLYRRNHDNARELEMLLEMGEQDRQRWEEAVTVARLVKAPAAEARALAKLGRTQEALRLLDAQAGDFTAVKAEVLLAAKRYKEAAALFAKVEDFYRQAKALQQLGAPEAKRAFNDAVVQVEFEVKEARLRAGRAKQEFDQIPGVVGRERARLRLAEAYGTLAEDYRRLADAYFHAGRDPATARVLANNAVKYLKDQRQTLEDRGQDAYGKEAVVALGIEARIAEIQAEASKYR